MHIGVLQHAPIRSRLTFPRIFWHQAVAFRSPTALELPEEVELWFLAGVTPFCVVQPLVHAENKRRRPHVAKMFEAHVDAFADDATSKLIWLALHNITTDWTRASHDWKTAMNQFAILYQDRFTRPPA